MSRVDGKPDPESFGQGRTRVPDSALSKTELQPQRNCGIDREARHVPNLWGGREDPGRVPDRFRGALRRGVDLPRLKVPVRDLLPSARDVYKRQVIV